MARLPRVGDQFRQFRVLERLGEGGTGEVFRARDTKLVDSGLAKFRESESDLTKTAAAVGTVGYMSPEQATGAEAGPASDVFSFGVLAYELLTGRLPFQGDSAAAVLYAIVHKPHAPLRGTSPP